MYRRLDEILKKHDAVLLTSPHSMRYFSGFSGGEGAVLITKISRTLFTDSRYTEQAEKEAAGFLVVCTNDYIGSAVKNAGEEGVSEILFEDGCMNVREFKRMKALAANMELLSGSEEIDALRMVKTEEELEKLQKAEDIGCQAFRHILGFIKPGVREIDVALEIEYFMRKNGAEGISFDTIAISGPNTSLPHGQPGSKKVEKGDFFTMDFGCIYNGYCSDMTRTVVVGKASEEQKRIYSVVKEAQQRGLEIIREGITGREADAAARKVIEEAGYGKYFGHSLGHGVGLLIHEKPNLSPKSETVLKENMIVTCEPGIYIPGFGGVRIEDMVCVKKDGIRNFTYETKELIEL